MCLRSFSFLFVFWASLATIFVRILSKGRDFGRYWEKVSFPQVIFPLFFIVSRVCLIHGDIQHCLCIVIVLLLNFLCVFFFSFSFVLILCHICMTAKSRWSLPQRNVTKHKDPCGLVVLSVIDHIHFARDPQTEALICRVTLSTTNRHRTNHGKGIFRDDGYLRESCELLNEAKILEHKVDITFQNRSNLKWSLQPRFIIGRIGFSDTRTANINRDMYNYPFSFTSCLRRKEARLQIAMMSTMEQYSDIFGTPRLQQERFKIKPIQW